MIEYRKIIRRADLRNEPAALFVFGDNMRRAGYGGQAAEMRGEPNAVGIATKWSPSRDVLAFFDDSDPRNSEILQQWTRDFARLKMHLLQGQSHQWVSDRTSRAGQTTNT